MTDWLIFCIGLLAGCGLAMIFTWSGAYLSHKARRQPGEPFIGEIKGEVFRIPDATDLSDYPADEPGEAETRVLERSKQFLKMMAG